MELAQKAAHVPYFLRGFIVFIGICSVSNKAHVPLSPSVSAVLTWSSEGSGTFWGVPWLARGNPEIHPSSVTGGGLHFLKLLWKYKPKFDLEGNGFSFTY